MAHILYCLRAVVRWHPVTEKSYATSRFTVSIHTFVAILIRFLRFHCSRVISSDFEPLFSFANSYASFVHDSFIDIVIRPPVVCPFATSMTVPPSFISLVTFGRRGFPSSSTCIRSIDASVLAPSSCTRIDTGPRSTLAENGGKSAGIGTLACLRGALSLINPCLVPNTSSSIILNRNAFRM